MASSSSLAKLSAYFVYLLVVATIGPLLFGFHLAELNSLENHFLNCQPESRRAPATANDNGILSKCISMNDVQFAVVTSFFTLGGLVGALAAGSLSNRYGRLKVMLLTSGFFTLGGSLEAVAPSITLLTLGRFFSGIGAGAATTVVPLYISEASPPERRGLFGTFTQIMVNVGILITLILGYYLNRGSMWRIILAIGGLIGSIQFIGLVLGGQESPTWLANNGRTLAARKALQKLRSKQTSIEDEMAGWNTDGTSEEEQSLIASTEGLQESSTASLSPKHAHHTTHSVFSVLKDPDARPAILAVVMIMLAQQLTGINSIIMYGVGLLVDLLESNAALLNMLVAVLNIITTIIAAPLVDKLGRKPCLLISITGMGVNSILLGVGIMNHIPLLSAVAVILFVASFGLGLGPVPFLLSPELVNADAVGATQSWALAANWTATFAVAQFFPIVNKAMGKGQVYFLFAGFALFFGLFTVFFVPETKGKKTADEVWGRAKAAVE